jgi:hypothetical protein
MQLVPFSSWKGEELRVKQIDRYFNNCKSNERAVDVPHKKASASKVNWFVSAAPLHLSNARSEPLFGCQLYLKLIRDWGTGSMRSSRRMKIAKEGRDWYSWLLPSPCLMLLTVLLLKH